ncbi:hypothetical protein NFI96_025544 [Prochilodus magdalenae]|nr:hypothetical protein NFI96_025544 [Prochilodus magdalenae]
MEPTATLSILALLLLGLSQAVPLMEPQHVDITAAILTTNTGSSELLVEGDIVIPRTRNALACPDNNCFWKKSWTGLVQVPYTLSADFTFSDRSVIAGAMATFHSKTCIRFVSRTNETDYLSIENRERWRDPREQLGTSEGAFRAALLPGLITLCYSPVGRSGGKQVVSPQQERLRACTAGIVQHELKPTRWVSTTSRPGRSDPRTAT